MKPLTLSILTATLIETGTAMVMLNAAPHQPLGFWLWFGGIAAAAPFQCIWLYRLLRTRGKRDAQSL